MTTAPTTRLWTDTYRERFQTKREHGWPSETLVRLFRGRFVPGIERNFTDRSILDVGCGDGNNIPFYQSLGMWIAATEVSEDICDRIRRRTADGDSDVDIRVGTNRSLPFPSDTFDYLVSWNTIHYETNADDMRSAIREYERVLKPGGRFFISTTGPEHLILEGAISLGEHRYQIEIDDFRKGQTFFYFDEPETIHDYFSPVFDDILIGRTRDELFTKLADFWLITGVKR